LNEDIVNESYCLQLYCLQLYRGVSVDGETGFRQRATLVLESFADLSGWKAGTENNTGAKGRFAKPAQRRRSS
jgi:hypothetical protein